MHKKKTRMLIKKWPSGLEAIQTFEGNNEGGKKNKSQIPFS